MIIRLQHLFPVPLLLLWLSGCAVQPPAPSDSSLTQEISERNQQLSALNKWKILGRIAFIQADKRESASLNWRYEQDHNDNTRQRLDLTAPLGINVLHLESDNGRHVLEVDGEEYHSEDLDALIYSLTGLTLPTRALSYWLKGLAYLPQDKLSYDSVTRLPVKLTSLYDNRLWSVEYQNYQLVNQHRLATKFTITQAELNIKILVKKWTL
ncbi:lipoprotein insertase outer membrane protein LolB [Thalassomonas actiniarum]|uniref:Outer-membrane lipoprotein LolB n=1 Tax=Thalassomonas actiniarum TaxID=485447 RepID=A0AAE9YMX7_9GAMM|nr:lipoprotein insertase outer membrane protein LolB [Thalassomonas actiniarum]WDD97722.1 outer membrane lipoprotein LolB [Thalassomonas actiniarum]